MRLLTGSAACEQPDADKQWNRAMSQDGQQSVNETNSALPTNREGLALCLSGGGFRATLFHSGALRRLNELGILSRTTTVTSVSGGSILAGDLALRWPELRQSESGGVFTAYDRLVAEPVREFCKQDLRTSVLLWDRVNPANWPALLSREYSITDRLAQAYADHLGMGVPLASLSGSPRLIICATNLETGACWEFQAGPDGRMGDYYTGWAPTGEMTLARAVAASSAFPLTFPPIILRFPDPAVFADAHEMFGQMKESKEWIGLTDGGVYDNLGLEPVWDTHRTLLVSDAGMPFDFDPDPKADFIHRTRRVFNISANQVGALRKRWLIDMFKLNKDEFFGTYWGIGSDVANYGRPDARGYRGTALALLKDVRTDLDSFADGEIASLENHGYALADVAARTWLEPLLPPEIPEFQWPHADLANEAAVSQALAESGQRGILKDIWESIRRQASEWF